MGLKTWIVKRGVFGGAVRLIARDFKVYRQAGMDRLTAYIAVVLKRYEALPTGKHIGISIEVLRQMRSWVGTHGDMNLRCVCYFVAQHEAGVGAGDEEVYRAIGEILVDLDLGEERRGSSLAIDKRYSTSDFDNAVKSLGHAPSLYIDPIIDSEEYIHAMEEEQKSARARSSTKKAVFRESDHRSNKHSYSGIRNHDSKAAQTKERLSSPRPQLSRPKVHDDRQAQTEPNRILRTPFCAPVIIEGPSPAIGGDKLTEDVGVVTSSGDFIAVLDKFSWLPHSRTFRIPLDTPTPEPVSVTFARRSSVFSLERTTLGTFLLTGFSHNHTNPNVLEIRVNAVDSGLYFDVRDAVVSRLTIARQS